MKNSASGYYEERVREALPAQMVDATLSNWMPGQVGLNAGILPSPGFTYVNMDASYDAGSYDDYRGKAIPVTGTYNVWAVENIFYYVFDGKVFGGNYGMMVMFPTPATAGSTGIFRKQALRVRSENLRPAAHSMNQSQVDIGRLKRAAQHFFGANAQGL